MCLEFFSKETWQQSIADEELRIDPCEGQLEPGGVLEGCDDLRGADGIETLGVIGERPRRGFVGVLDLDELLDRAFFHDREIDLAPFLVADVAQLVAEAVAILQEVTSLQEPRRDSAAPVSPVFRREIAVGPKRNRPAISSSNSNAISFGPSWILGFLRDLISRESVTKFRRL